MITKFDIHELFPNSQTINKHRDITVYHGTAKYFDNFDFKKVGTGTVNDYLSLLGIHFTEKFEIAKSFIKQDKNTNRVLSCQLHLNKTLKLTEHELVLGIIKYGLSKGYTIGDYQDMSDFKEISKIPYYDRRMIKQDLHFYLSQNSVYPKKMVSEFKRNVLLKNGYDSIEYLNQIEKEQDIDRYDFISLIPNVIEVMYSHNV